jgi:hypothetical protein
LTPLTVWSESIQSVQAIKGVKSIKKNRPSVSRSCREATDAEAALRVEAAAIDALGLPALTNKIRGWRSTDLGRTPLAELVALYRKKPVTIREPAIVIRINRLYRPGMSAAELYDATRGIWKIDPRRPRRPNTPSQSTRGSCARSTK